MNRLSLCLLVLGSAPLALAEPVSVAVIPFQTRTLARQTVEVLDDLVVAEVSSMAGVHVISPSDVNAVLGFESMQVALGCDDARCAAEIGGALGITYMVAGTVDVLGQQLLLTATLFNSKEMRAEARIKVTIPNVESHYIEGVHNLLSQLFSSSSEIFPALALEHHRENLHSRDRGYVRTHRLGFAVLGRYGSYRQSQCDDDRCRQLFSKLIPVVAYQWQHGDYLALRLKGGLAVGRREGLSGQGGPWGFLSVGEELVIALIGAMRPWRTVSNTPVAFVAAADLELDIGEALMGRMLAGAGFRILWFTLMGHLGVAFGPHVEGRHAVLTDGSTAPHKPSGLTYGFTAGTTFAL